VANDGSYPVSVIDTASNTVVATVGVGEGPLGVAITPGVGPPTNKDQCKEGGWETFTIHGDSASLKGAPKMLEHKIRHTGDVTILDLNGRISLTDALWSASGVVLGQVIRELVKKGERKIVLNLKGVTYIDSSGIGELMGALTSVQKQGGELKLVNPIPRVIDLLRITRLDTLLDVRDDENSAIQSFSSRIAAAG